MQVGYCQGLNYLAGMLLLVMQRDEERSFWVLVSLLDEGAAQACRWCLRHHCRGIALSILLHSCDDAGF